VFAEHDCRHLHLAAVMRLWVWWSVLLPATLTASSLVVLHVVSMRTEGRLNVVEHVTSPERPSVSVQPARS